MGVTVPVMIGMPGSVGRVGRVGVAGIVAVVGGVAGVAGVDGVDGVVGVVGVVAVVVGVDGFGVLGLGVLGFGVLGFGVVGVGVEGLAVVVAVLVVFGGVVGVVFGSVDWVVFGVVGVGEVVVDVVVPELCPAESELARSEAWIHHGVVGSVAVADGVAGIGTSGLPTGEGGRPFDRDVLSLRPASGVDSADGVWAWV
ncbi:hypothetical protein ACWGID_35575 [Kribbella sp. NPDC054772]